MDVKPFFTVILLIFLTILSTTDCELRTALEKGKGLFKRGRTRHQNSAPAKKTSSIRRAITGAILKENDLKKLQHLILFEADLIKVAAYKKLLKMYKEDTNGDQSHKLIPLIIKGATELIKYYGVGPMKNIIKLKLTFDEGMRYANKCITSVDQSHIGTCYKLKAQLLEAYVFSSPVLMNRVMRKQLRDTINKARDELGNDYTIAFLETKIACEMQFKMQTRKNYVNKVKKLFMGLTNEEITMNCVHELPKFKERIIEVGSYIGEYNYLLGRAYAKEGNYSKALEVLNEARQEMITDTKRRQMNKEVQRYVEKLYLLEKTY